jgi:hypothetical protein
VAGQDNEMLEVSRAVARIHTGVLVLVCAIMAGMGLFTITAWLVIKGGHRVGPHLALLSQFFPGYSVTWAGSFVGLLYGMIVGGIGGWLIGAVYNGVVGLRE